MCTLTTPSQQFTGGPAAAAAKSLQTCPTLCDPIDGSPPGPPVHGILQARTLEWVSISLSKSNCRKKESEVSQSCAALCDPMDYSLPGSSVHGIFQAKVAISFSDVTLSFPNSISKMLLFLVCFYFSALIVLKSEGE